MNTPHQKLIAQTVAKHSRHIMPGYMTGPALKNARREIITVATGTRPKSSDCGVNKMMEALYAAFPLPLPPTCLAHQERMLSEQISLALQ